MPTVSIIIPVHNPGKYLEPAIESIVAQTFGDWEIVVIDDNSSEDLSWVPTRFPRAMYVKQSHGGVSVARNRGILSTAGPLIAFMDQDDVWEPQKLERQVSAMTQVADAALCYCDLRLIDSNGYPMEGMGSVSQSSSVPYEIELDGTVTTMAADRRSPLHRSLRHFSSRFVVPSTVMIRRSNLATSGLLDPFIPFSGDYDLLIKLGSRHKVLRIPYIDTLYRKHDNNFSDQYDVGRKEVEALVGRYVSYAKSKGDSLLARDAGKMFRRSGETYSAQAFDCARRSLRRREYSSFFSHLVRATWFSPKFVGRSLVWKCFHRRDKAVAPADA